MSETLGNLRRKINGAGKLGAVVRSMKALAASNIGQYENAVRALADYDRTVELGLVAFFRQLGTTRPEQNDTTRQSTGMTRPQQDDTKKRSVSTTRPAQGDTEKQSANMADPQQGDTKKGFVSTTRPVQINTKNIGVVVFGSDQGLVGKFNEELVDFTADALTALPGEKHIWAVGERLHARLQDANLPPMDRFAVPNAVSAISPLVGQLLTRCEMQRRQNALGQVYLFHNRPKAGALYEPVSQRLLPLDEEWHRGLTEIRWPTTNLPEILVDGETTLQALIGEYLFVSLFKACAESLASENASRLAAMQRAEKNIGELLESLQRSFHGLRQSTIDEELFDVISGYESLIPEPVKE